MGDGGGTVATNTRALIVVGRWGRGGAGGRAQGSVSRDVGGYLEQRRGGRVGLQCRTGGDGCEVAAPEHRPQKQVSIYKGMVVAHAVTAAVMHGARDAGKRAAKESRGGRASKSG